MQSKDTNIIRKVIAGSSSRENARRVVEWFSSSVEGQAYLSDLIDRDAYLMETENNQSPTVSPIVSDRIMDNITNNIRQRKNRKVFIQIAATLIPIICIIGFGIYLNRKIDLFGENPMVEAYATKGEVLRVMFQDGSEAILNSDSRLHYPQKFGFSSRKVFLEGEAYFKVASNKQRPFEVVVDGAASIKVLGTSFNVNAYRDQSNVKVVLDNGNILFSTPRNIYTLEPSQEIVYDKKSGVATITSLRNSAEASSWRENKILFEDTPLLDVLKTINRRYNVKCEIIDDNVFAYTYTLHTKKTTLPDILDELGKLSPVKFSLQDNKLIVSM